MHTLGKLMELCASFNQASGTECKLFSKPLELHTLLTLGSPSFKNLEKGKFQLDNRQIEDIRTCRAASSQLKTPETLDVLNCAESVDMRKEGNKCCHFCSLCFR